MKRLAYLVLSILLIGVIVFLVYRYRADFGLASPGSGRGTSGNSSMQGTQIVWQTVDRSADGFKIQMPVSAGETQVPAYADGGVVEQVDMIEASVDPETTYAVAWDDNPPVERLANEDIEKTLDLARNGALGRTQTTLVSESRNSLGGYPSLDFSARNAGGGILNARLILDGTRLYMLIAAFPSASARRGEDVNHFFDSFSLTQMPGTN